MFPLGKIMTKGVVVVKENTPIYEAIEALVDNKVSGLPVVDEGNNLVGVLSEWDVLELLTDHEIKKDTQVKDYMTKEVISFEENDSAIDVCEFFKKSNKRRVPIVRDHQLIGIVSRHDLIKLILQIRKRVLNK